MFIAESISVHEDIDLLTLTPVKSDETEKNFLVGMSDTKQNMKSHFTLFYFIYSYTRSVSEGFILPEMY